MNIFETAKIMNSDATVYEKGKIVAEGKIRLIGGSRIKYKVENIEINVNNAKAEFLDEYCEEIEIYM